LPAWITADDVKDYSKVTYDMLGYANDDAFVTFLTDKIIPRVQSHINTFCRRDFDVDFPGAIPNDVKDLAARVAANILQYIIMNKMGPLIREREIKLTIPEQDIFKGVEKQLDRWVKRTPITKASSYKEIEEE